MTYAPSEDSDQPALISTVWSESLLCTQWVAYVPLFIHAWMDGWVRVLRPFNSISVISRRWKGEHERLCAMKRRLGSGRISPPAGFEPATPWSEVGSANRSATRTLRLFMQTTKIDQTGHMPRLIWVFARRTGHFVGFVMLQLICLRQ